MSKPNILLIVSDQERQRGWLPQDVSLPWRQRLIDEGLELTSYWTHSAPCSPSRATLMTGRYLPGHGVVDNVIFPWHKELDFGIPTVGKLLTDHAGYRSSYIGKWHLSYGPSPDMAAYGYSDWEGNDQHFMGWAGTGVHFDPVIADNAAAWIRDNANATEPWFLTVALVNPHDVMWFPIDQPDWQREHEEMTRNVKGILELSKWKDDESLPTYDRDYPEIFDTLPASFDDDLHSKPEAHRAWRHAQQHGLWGYIDPSDTKAWLRHLDYYVELHRLADESLGTVLGALEASGRWDDTIVIFTSDHGDMCGSHGLRSTGPFVYDEIMNIPFYVKAPGITHPGSTSTALASHVDLAPTICSLAGVDPSTIPSLQGVDLSPVLSDPGAAVRDHVLFAMDSAHTKLVQGTRYAIRGMFDGRYKYARYYGIGGGMPNDDYKEVPPPKLYDVDAGFDDCDHELYDHLEDPHEVVNLAHDRGRRAEQRERYEHLSAIEKTDLEPA